MSARKTTQAREAAAPKAPVPAETTAPPVDLPVEPTPEPTPPVEPAPPAVKGADQCGVPGCPRKPTTHVVCDAHWATHRGYATKE